MDLTPVRELVLDPRRAASPPLRRAYADDVADRYTEVAAAMAHLETADAWQDQPPQWCDEQLQLAAEVVLQLGELGGDYERVRDWGERVLELSAAGPAPRRAELMLRLSELHRVTGNAERNAELVRGAGDLIGVLDLSPDELAALAPISCHALFCLGALAVVEERHADARTLLKHAWHHGGDSEDHLWSLVNFAYVESLDGRHEAALALTDAAVAMAERMGDGRGLNAARNNRACTLRELGRYAESCDEFSRVLPAILEEDVPDTVLTSAEDFATVLVAVGRAQDAAVLVGAAEAERQALGVPRVALQEAELAPWLAKGRARVGDDWDAQTARGAELGLLAAVALALSAGS